MGGGIALAVLRVVAGLAAAGLGLRFIGDRADRVDDLTRWQVPAPTTTALLGGIVAVVAGLLLVTGLASRFGALVLLVLSLAATATAGRVDGGMTLALLVAGCVAYLVLTARGGGAFQLLDRIEPRSEQRMPSSADW